VHDCFPSDISEWRVSCSNTITPNLQPSTESVSVGLALKSRTTWDGWKQTAILPGTVFRRLPRLLCFADFAQKRGCTDVASAVPLVEEFVSEWLVQHGAEAKTSASLRKHAIDIGNATRQMLRLASGDPVRHNRHSRPFPLESEVPGFHEYFDGTPESCIICMNLDNTSEKPASVRSVPCRLRFWHLSSSNVRREWLPARAEISVVI
jgi:hypothetical protein